MARFGVGGQGEFAPADGTTGAVTDDAQLTLWTAELLLRARHGGRRAPSATSRPPSAVDYLREIATKPVSTMRLSAVVLGCVLASAIQAQPVSPLYDAAREAGASQADAAGLVSALRGEDPIQEAVLRASDRVVGDRFGASVSLAGERALIGVPADGDGTPAGEQTGAAYVFVRSGASWTQEAKLTAADGGRYDRFGTSVSLSEDRALIGADGVANYRGVAYVFVRSGTTWTQEARLTALDAAARDFFGAAVSLSGDRALVGAIGDDAGGLTLAGAAYVFARDGSEWTQQAKLRASDRSPESRFGSDVSLFGDRALIGAYSDSPLGVSSGSAYVFAWSNGQWREEAKLVPDDGNAGDWFGSVVSLSADRALIGAPLDDDRGANSGSAYVFARTGTTWTREAKLLAADMSESDVFGGSVSLAEGRAVVGMPGDDDRGDRSGSAYVFVRSGPSWSQESKLTAADGGDGDEFGYSLDILRGRVLVGAVWAPSGTGAAYAYVIPSAVGTEDDVPYGGALSLPVPNPVTGRTTLTLTVDRPQIVRAVLVDALGRDVRVIFDGALAREAELVVQTADVPAGVYVVRVAGESFLQTRRLTVAR